MLRLILFIAIPCISLNLFAQSLGNCHRFEVHPHQLIFITQGGEQLSLKAYSNYNIRVQVHRKGEQFFSDDHYEMVANHKMNGTFIIQDKGTYFSVSTTALQIKVNKQPLSVEFIKEGDNTVLMQEQNSITWNKNNITTTFVSDSAEHFCGLGHQAFGLVPSLDLRGQIARSNYGDHDYNTDDGGWLAQGFLVVPFYMSSKGYGVFLNSTFPNRFSFGKDSNYYFSIDTRGYDGRLDYFFILGPSLRNILDRYTLLTGRPRLPQRSIFGLQLSDKDNPNNEGASWWMNKIKEHRAAGLPLDHIVNDNRWRAGTGAWSGSWFEWDKTRYPDPKAYSRWVDSNGLTLTLDLNRNNGAASWGWKPSYNIPNSGMVKESYSVPDYSSPVVRNWVWSLFWKESFNPALHYPGDALWMDEIDELFTLPDSVILANKRSWAENRNYYPFLVAKAVVQEGWDNKNKNEPPGIGEAKRPFMWGRGSTAGAQRYATHWTGDLRCSYEWMKKTIRGMQASGLSGFPYFNHDAGGFREPGPDDTMYVQWAMAFGSFTPIWRPHGIGSPRWPLGRSAFCQNAAKVYSHLRYELMPYIYTNAYNAYEHGVPMARPMLLDYAQYPEAWKYDLQYMWGDNMLVAPQTTGIDSTYNIWLPAGNKWYYLWNDSVITGGQVIQFNAVVGQLPVFVRSGAIIPKYDFALSTGWLNKQKLTLEVYTGKSGSFTLYEDDNVTEKYRTRNEKSFTNILYDNVKHSLLIMPATGKYKGAPLSRKYHVVIHCADRPKAVTINGESTTSFKYDLQKKLLIINSREFSLSQIVLIKYN